MQTECSADLFGLTSVERCRVVVGFDGGQTTPAQAGEGRFFHGYYTQERRPMTGVSKTR